MNADQKILALETLLEKVRTNAAKPRPARGSQPMTAASRATDDVAGPAVPARVPPPTAVAPGMTKFADDDWSDTTETFDTPVPLAAPLPGPAKATATTTSKPGLAKPAAATPKPSDVAAAKPATAPAAVAPAAKPAAVTPAAKPAAVTPAAKPPLVTPVIKPTTPANTPIPLTNKLAPPVIKPPVIPTITTAKLVEPNLNRTLTGVGEGAVKAPEIRPGPIAAAISIPTTPETPPVEPVLELEKKAVLTKADAPAKPALPSAIEEAEGEEENEPTQLFEHSAASRRAAELAALSEKQLEDVRKSLGVDKKGESDKVELRLPDAKLGAEKSEKIELKSPLDPPWMKEKSEGKIDLEKIGVSLLDDKNFKKGPSQTELDLELVASQREVDLEKIDLDVAEAKQDDAKRLSPLPLVPEDKPTVPAITEKPPISEKKPIVVTKPDDDYRGAATTKPSFVRPADIEKAQADEQLLVKPSQPTRGVSKLLIVGALILVLAAGAFIAMQQGLIPGLQPTVAPPTTATQTATQTAAPPTAQTTAKPDVTAPAASASAAAPADSVAAPADSAAAAPADSAAVAPADSAAAPPASASAAAAPPEPPVAVAGAPSVDPATLNNNQGLIFVTANKPGRVYLTGKLAGDVNTELKVECGLKFVRLADPTQDVAKPPVWLTPGKPQQIDCRKYTKFEVTVP